jgi:hypothetical protein
MVHVTLTVANVLDSCALTEVAFAENGFGIYAREGSITSRAGGSGSAQLIPNGGLVWGEKGVGGRWTVAADSGGSFVVELKCPPTGKSAFEVRENTTGFGVELEYAGQQGPKKSHMYEVSVFRGRGHAAQQCVQDAGRLLTTASVCVALPPAEPADPQAGSGGGGGVSVTAEAAVMQRANSLGMGVAGAADAQRKLAVAERKLGDAAKAGLALLKRAREDEARAAEAISRADRTDAANKRLRDELANATAECERLEQARRRATGAATSARGEAAASTDVTNAEMRALNERLVAQRRALEEERDNAKAALDRGAKAVDKIATVATAEGRRADDAEAKLQAVLAEAGGEEALIAHVATAKASSDMLQQREGEIEALKHTLALTREAEDRASAAASVAEAAQRKAEAELAEARAAVMRLKTALSAVVFEEKSGGSASRRGSAAGQPGGGFSDEEDFESPQPSPVSQPRGSAKSNSDSEAVFLRRELDLRRQMDGMQQETMRSEHALADANGRAAAAAEAASAAAAAAAEESAQKKGALAKVASLEAALVEARTALAHSTEAVEEQTALKKELMSLRAQLDTTRRGSAQAEMSMRADADAARLELADLVDEARQDGEDMLAEAMQDAEDRRKAAVAAIAASMEEALRDQAAAYKEEIADLKRNRFV